jgi:hypothetical protein
VALYAVDGLILCRNPRSNNEMTVSQLEKFRVPLGGQEVELQEIVHAEGAMPMLRIRIREGKRFTIFDVDPVTANSLARAISRWAEAQGE